MTNGVNPYYAAWKQRTGGGPNWEFINWMHRRWLEIEAEYKRPRHTITADEFLAWLDN